MTSDNSPHHHPLAPTVDALPAPDASRAAHTIGGAATTTGPDDATRALIIPPPPIPELAHSATPTPPPPGALDAPGADDVGFVSRRALVTAPSVSASEVARSTPRETWKWLWKDTLGRVVPFVIAAGVYGQWSGLGWSGIGVRRSTLRELGRDLAWGVGVGLPLAGLAAAFRAWVAPRYRLPTASDQALQTVFYLGINAPAEELFWRGFMQTMIINGLGRLRRRLPRGRGRTNATPAATPASETGRADVGAGVMTPTHEPGVAEAALGWALTTAIFGAYHRLGGWSWRSIAGVTAAGGVFGAMYLLPRKRRSIIPASVVHGLATAAFLSWGDATLHLLSRRQRG